MIDRRGFLKMSVAGLASLTLHRAAALPAPGGERRLAMLYDDAKCIGCRACQIACKQWNKLEPVSADLEGVCDGLKGPSPDAWTVIRLTQYPLNDRRSFLFMKVGCMHCGKPACAAVCPTGALRKQPNGLVTLDRSLCNGCGHCSQACPFDIPQVRQTNHLAGAAKSAKCTFCQERVAEDLRPYCVQSCPAGALDWGDRRAMLAKARNRLEELRTDFPQVNLYGESELGGLGLLYLLLAPPEAYGLPRVRPSDSV